MTMPVWLQVFYIVFSVVILGWAAWITKMIMSHEKIIAAILERCQNRGVVMDDVQENIKAILDATRRTDRNIIRLGIKAGIEIEN